MFIKRIRLTNFKGFLGEREWLAFNTPNNSAGSGLNVLVGENNIGKSTLFEAVDFLRNGTKKSPSDIKNKNASADADTHVEIEFGGDVRTAIDGFSQPNKVTVFQRYVYEDDAGEQFIRFVRSLSDAKTIKLWANDEGEYKNESGIDAPVKKLFEMNFVWADTNPENEASFGASTVCGNLLKGIAQSFTETEAYQEFATHFHNTFNSENSALRQRLREIEERTQQKFREHFGNAEIKFRFNELDIDSFFKKTDIDVNDGTETSFQEKGSGMQRSIALALLQVYAEELVRHPDNEALKKPFFLFIDEPELCLHPLGQKNLLNALLELSKTSQIFLATHSPYFLISEHLRKIGLFVFNKTDDVEIIKLTSEGGSLPWSPTWGEVNFHAFNLPTVEFHNELYGFLQEKSEKWTLSEFNRFLLEQGLKNSRTWTQEMQGVVGQSFDVPLPTFIRNKIHHPENRTMQQIRFSDEDFRTSIQQMIRIIQNMTV